MNLTKASTLLFQLLLLSSSLFVSANGQNLKASAAKSKSGKQEQEYNCREDLYGIKYDEWERTSTDDGLTIRNYIPIYGYKTDDEGVGSPDYTTIIGEYNSVDSIIPRGSKPTPEGDLNGPYTCQQQAIFGFNLTEHFISTRSQAVEFVPLSAQGILSTKVTWQSPVEWESTNVLQEKYVITVCQFVGKVHILY